MKVEISGWTVHFAEQSYGIWSKWNNNKWNNYELFNNNKWNIYQ